MLPDGSFVKHTPDPGLPADDPSLLGTHQLLMQRALEGGLGSSSEPPA